MIIIWSESSDIFGSRLHEYWLLDANSTLHTEKLIVINIYMQFTSVEWLHQMFDPEPELKARMCYFIVKKWYKKHTYVDGLVQEKHKSFANALELRLSCTNLFIYLQTSLAPKNGTDKYFKGLRGWLISHHIFLHAA